MTCSENRFAMNLTFFSLSESIKDIALETLAGTLKETIGLEEVYFSFAK